MGTLVCPELTYLASRRARFEHVIALQRIALEFAELLERQRTEREKLLHNHAPGMPRSYANIEALVRGQHADGHRALGNAATEFARHRDRYEAEAGWLLARLRKVPHEKGTAQSGPGAERARRGLPPRLRSG